MKALEEEGHDPDDFIFGDDPKKMDSSGSTCMKSGKFSELLSETTYIKEIKRNDKMLYFMCLMWILNLLAVGRD